MWLGGVKAVLGLLLLIALVTAMPEQRLRILANESTLGFPAMTQDVKEMAKKLMLSCSRMGYRPPVVRVLLYPRSMDEGEEKNQNPFSLFSSLLSSLPPPLDTSTSSRQGNMFNESGDILSQEAEWNVTEELLNTTSLPDAIDIVKNSTDEPRCFMQAFVSPLAWLAVLRGSAGLRPQDFSKLLWAARPIMQSLSPRKMRLPAYLDQEQLKEMMALFSEMFGALSERQRGRIRDWLKARVLENDFNCTLGHPSGSYSYKPRMQAGPGVFTLSPEGQTRRPYAWRPVRPKLGRCAPKTAWLNRKVLRIMGRFLSRLPPQEVNVIPQEELCEFSKSSDFPRAFESVGPIQASLGRALLARLKKDCTSKQDFLQLTKNLDSLMCFYDDKVESLDEAHSKQLLSQLQRCQNTVSNKLKRQLVRKLISSAGVSVGEDLLMSLGSAAATLPPSRLGRFPAEVLNATLSSLSQAPWSPAQASTVAKALLKKAKRLSSKTLLSLGTLARGVNSAVLRNISGKELLHGEAKQQLERVSRRMSRLQRKALLQGMSSDLSVSDMVQRVPASLLSSLSLRMLQRARLTSVDQLEGRNWTRAQAAFLLKRILGTKVRVQQLRRLGRAVQGVTCEMIDSLAANETVESVEALSRSAIWLTKAQMRCAAQKLFASLEQERQGYFSGISPFELEQIPAMMLLYLRAEKIKTLPEAVCDTLLEKVLDVNVSHVPQRSPSRAALTQRALDCLGKNTSELSSEEVLSLGPLLCELAPSQLAQMAPDTLNGTLLAMASCFSIRRQYRARLFKMVTNTFGAPSNWSEEDMLSLRPFLLLNESALRDLPDTKPWLRSSLSDLLDSLPEAPSDPLSEEFGPQPNRSALRWKLFKMVTKDGRKPASPAESSQRSRSLPGGAIVKPTAALMEQLGQDNVFWSPGELASIAPEVFNEAITYLGQIQDYSREQLASLREKVIESWGPLEHLNESQLVELGCVSQGLESEELQQLNITSLDTMELLASCSWTQEQRRAIWQGFVQRGSSGDSSSGGVSAAQLGELEMVGLGQFICGLQPEEIQQLNTNSFSEAVETLGSAPCELPQMESLKRKAVATFGPAQDWNEGQVSALGNIMGGLDMEEMKSLKSSVLSFISSSAIPLIPPQRLAALSVSQLQALGPDNAAMVTDAQKAELGEEQKRALAESMGAEYSRTEEDASSGASSGSAGGQDGSSLPQSGGAESYTVEGVVFLLKPMMFLLLGLLF